MITHVYRELISGARDLVIKAQVGHKDRGDPWHRSNEKTLNLSSSESSLVPSVLSGSFTQQVDYVCMQSMWLM